MTKANITVLGAGSWGTALAIHLANNGHDVCLWGRDSAKVKRCEKARCNKKYLPDAPFPKNLSVTSDLEAAMAEADYVLINVPSRCFEEILEQIKPYIMLKTKLIWATKGLSDDGELLHQVVTREIPSIPHAVISGPSFAKEVAAGLPTVVIVASEVGSYADEVAELFVSKCFRVYTSQDIIGVQIGGAIKNVLAVAVGVSDGLGYGANARSALISRGLVELLRFGHAMGGQDHTFMGLSGLGDLILTCTDDQSRNRRLGIAIGHGKSIKQAAEKIGQAVEAVHTVSRVYQLAQEHKVDMPITEQVFQIVHGHTTPEEAVKSLFARSKKAE